MAHKTTEKDFAIFEKECWKWVEHFGLKDWQFNLYHEDSKILGPCRAWKDYNYEGRVCTLGLTIDWKNDDVTVYQVKKSAFHEVCHIMLATLHNLFSTVNRSEREAELWGSEEHAIIRRLENSIFEESLRSKNETLY